MGWGRGGRRRRTRTSSRVEIELPISFSNTWDCMVGELGHKGALKPRELREGSPGVEGLVVGGEGGRASNTA